MSGNTRVGSVVARFSPESCREGVGSTHVGRNAELPEERTIELGVVR